MHAPERLDGLRVVATPDALDHAWFEGDVIVFRIAHDEVIAFGAASRTPSSTTWSPATSSGRCRRNAPRSPRAWLQVCR